jgi:hypothetical protein
MEKAPFGNVIDLPNPWLTCSRLWKLVEDVNIRQGLEETVRLSMLEHVKEIISKINHCSFSLPGSPAFLKENFSFLRLWSLWKGSPCRYDEAFWRSLRDFSQPQKSPNGIVE